MMALLSSRIAVESSLDPTVVREIVHSYLQQILRQLTRPAWTALKIRLDTAAELTVAGVF